MKGPVVHFGTHQEIVYTNHKGETALRRIIAQHLWFGVSPYFDGAQWFIEAFDLDQHDRRTFALSGIRTT